MRRQIMMLAGFLAALGLFGLMAVYFGGRGGGGGGKTEPERNVSGPAPAFTLPTIAGDEFVSADHVGKHALLLYFNEGVG